MSKKVWKYELSKPVQNQVVIEMPQGAEILRLYERRLLVLVDPAAPKVPVALTVVRTDEEFAGEGLRYIGTYGHAAGGEPVNTPADENAGQDDEGEASPSSGKKYRYFHVFCPETKANGKKK